MTAGTDPAEAAEVELEATGIAHGGTAVARLDGRVVFVADAIPGERVLARISDASRAAFLRADTVRVLDPSPHRREHVWHAASLGRDPSERAGGAEFGHIDLAHQRELKRRVLTEALERMAGLRRDVEVEPLPSGASPEAVPDATGTGWRTRVRLHVDAEGRVGPYAARSHRVVPVDDLPLAVPGTEALLRRHPGADRVEAVVPSDGEPRVLVDGDGADETVAERVGARRFELDAGGFWQVHRHAATTLADAAGDAVDPDRFDADARHLDLYGGVGLLAAAVGDRFGRGIRITSVEGDRRATAHARRNLADWKRSRAVTARVDRFLERLRRESDASALDRLRHGTVVLDPPRSGAGKAVTAHLAALAPAQLVYVACDPVALARDLAALTRSGYEMRGLRAFDLFPSTHHVEAVATLVRVSEKVFRDHRA